MKLHTFLLACSLTTTIALADEVLVSPALESVGLFKNGLAVVRLSFPVAGPGNYRWEKVPRVVHGSLWIESDGIISVQSTTRMVEQTDKIETPTGTLQRDLAGKQVTITLKNRDSSESETYRGTVWTIPAAAPSKSWNTDYSSLNPNSGSYYWYSSRLHANQAAIASTPNTGNFLVLDDDSANRRYIDQSRISTLSVDGPFQPRTRKIEKPVLIFNVTEAPSAGGTVQVSYLTKGFAWLPSYQVDLSDPKSLSIRQSAVIRNEMDDLHDTKIELISGFPNVRFGAVDSPLWPGTNLTSFFQQVNQSGSTAGGILSNNIISQQMVYSNFRGSENSGSPLPTLAEEGQSSDDIHYESIGRHSMKAGDSLSLDIARAKTKYQRVVEWVVPDPRDERGRYQRRNNNNSDIGDQTWDAVLFTNPFKFPMTTAAAQVVENGKFRGQSLSTWVNPGQETCLRITRALSVRTESSEIEEEGKREIIWIAGDDFRRTTVKGRLAVQNFRGKEVTLRIRAEFSGKLLEADSDPETTLRREGVSSINPRRQLNWTITLPAGEEKIIHYRYQVLVDC